MGSRNATRLACLRLSSAQRRISLKRIALVAITLLSLALTGCTGGKTPAISKSWVDGACSQATPGVTLSVDYLGEVKTHCALNYDGNGWGLFEAAGFEVQGTSKYPTAFACKIDGEPNSFKCDESDPQTSYWGYYTVSDGKWMYATTGASDHKSTCGTWEGWVFMENEQTKSHLPEPTEFSCK